MKALVYEAPRRLSFREFAPVACPPGEAEVKISAAGICGSDIHAFLGHDERRPPPLILGHEAAGECEGAAVIVNPLAVCGACEACRAGRDNLCAQREIISMPPRQGAFAERAFLPRANLLPLPPGLSPQQGALAEPLACGWHAAALAARHGSRPLENSSATVIGGGAIGLASALALAARGAHPVHIAEANPLRHPALRKAGDFAVAPPDQLPASHVVVDAVGSEESRQLAARTVLPGGAAVHIGLASAEGGFDMRRMTLQEIVLCGSYTYTAADFAETVRSMAEGSLGPLDWFEERPMSEGARAFDDLIGGRAAAPKIVLIP